MLTICAVILLAQGATGQPTLSLEARQYVTAALDLMEKNALDRDRIDWPVLRRDTMEKAAGAQVPADTYEALRFAVRSLGDHHSSFLTPDMVAERSMAARSSAPSGSVLENAFAHVVVPQFASFDQRTISGYATTLQRLVKTLDESKPCGWIVDLRQNGGGNMWPMLAGLGPLLDTGSLGSFGDRKTPGPAWSYREGAAWLGSTMVTKIDETPYELQRKQPPIAVLIGSATASSAEAIAIAFQGNSNTRTFGQRTRGLATANAPFKLSDGAILNLTQAVMMDRTGRTYDNGITPAELADAASPSIPAAAREWLSAQPTCRQR